MKTQIQIFYEVNRRIGERNELFCEMVRNGEMTKSDLRALIKRRPEIYSIYTGFLDSLPETL